MRSYFIAVLLQFYSTLTRLSRELMTTLTPGWTGDVFWLEKSSSSPKSKIKINCVHNMTVYPIYRLMMDEWMMKRKIDDGGMIDKSMNDD